MCPLSEFDGTEPPSLYLAIEPRGDWPPPWCPSRRATAGAGGELVTGGTDSPPPLRRCLRWTRSLRDRGERTPLVRTTESPPEKGPRWCASCHFDFSGGGSPSISMSTRGLGPRKRFSYASRLIAFATTSTPPGRCGSFGAFGRLPYTSGIRFSSIQRTMSGSTNGLVSGMRSPFSSRR